MNARTLVAGLLALGAALSAAARAEGTTPAAHAAETPATTPSVVIVVFDALRPDHLGAYGYRTRPTSPTFDRLAEESVLFATARSSAPYTLASVATILTGRPPDEHTLTTFERALPAEVPTLPRLLAPAGYRSVVASRSGILRGFGIEDDFELRFVDPKLTGDARAFRRAWKEALTTLASGERPWLAYLHFFPPHAPYRPPKGFALPFELPSAAGVSGAVAFLQSLDRGEVKLDDAGREALLARYDANIRVADHELDDLLAYLRGLEVLERVWLVVTSDHGEAFGEHGRFEHNSTVYDEMVRVPLLVRPPGGLAKGIRVEEPVGLVDLAPTVLTWASQPVPTTFAGRMWPLSERARYAARTRPVTVRSASPPEWFAITDGDWKYMRPLAWARGGPEQLYDVTSDPRERNDVAASRPDLLGRMRTAADRELALQREHAATTRPLSAMPADTADALRALGYVQ
ncbi:MAG: sulfatase [Deltaproteobacteria bacterium]|nr:sulfatase [Deltaproteobacteria bacterium]